MQLGLQPRVLNQQGTRTQTNESKGEGLGPTNSTQVSITYRWGWSSQCISRVVSTGSDWAEFFLQAFSTLGKLVPTV